MTKSTPLTDQQLKEYFEDKGELHLVHNLFRIYVLGDFECTVFNTGKLRIKRSFASMHTTPIAFDGGVVSLEFLNNLITSINIK